VAKGLTGRPGAGRTSPPTGAEAALDALLGAKEASQTYRTFMTLERSPAVAYPSFLSPDGSVVLSMCLNDYLGLSQDPRAREAAKAAIDIAGVGTGGSRNIGGTRSTHVRLEAEIRDLHRHEDALLYTSANAANSDLVSAIARAVPDTVFLSDAENHASIIEPMRSLGRQHRAVFKHNDVASLDEAYRPFAAVAVTPVLIVESLYSMSGEWAPLMDMAAWAEEKRALFFVNEVHAVGVRGNGGAGRLEELGIADRVHAVVGSFSKAFGSVGGYLVGRHRIIDVCRQTGTGSIFTTSLPEHVAAAALANLQRRRSDDVEVRVLMNRVATLRSELARRHVTHGGAQDSHIIPVIIGDEARCRAISKALLERGYYVTPICHPTVPMGAARLRVIVTPLHSEGQIIAFVNCLADLLD
jgi:5-aminolevulinate synthase